MYECMCVCIILRYVIRYTLKFKEIWEFLSN